jgi:DNA-binding CsgD family transcriptional regulator
MGMSASTEAFDVIDQAIHAAANAGSLEDLELGLVARSWSAPIVGLGVQWWRTSPRAPADWTALSGVFADEIGAGLTLEGETWASLAPKALRRERTPEVLGVSVPTIGRMHTYGALTAHLRMDQGAWLAQQNGWLGRLLLLACVAHDRVERLSADPTVARLAPREIECLSLAAEGLKAKQIADELGIGQQTVQFHLARARLKLSAGNTVQAVVRAAKLGVLRTRQ